MARRVLSIETGIWWTKVAVIEPKKKNPSVSKVFYFETPERSVEDGYIRDKEAFSNALKSALDDNDVEEREVIFTLNSSKIVTREITIPAIKENLLRGVIETQAKDYFPMDVSDYSITYLRMKNLPQNGTVSSVEDDLSETSTFLTEEKASDVKELFKKRKKVNTDEELKLLLIAVPENLQNNYISLCEMADLKFNSFEYLACSAGSFINQNFEGNNIVIQVVDQSTIISLIADGKLVFLRVAPYGYGTTISTVLDNPVLGCKTEKEAIKFLTEHDVFHETPDPAKFAKGAVEDEEKLKKDLVNAYEDVIDSLNYHKRVVTTALDYYKSQTKNDFNGQLHLIGEGLSIKGLREGFIEQLGFETANSNYFSYVNLAKDAIEPKAVIDPEDFVAVLGSALMPVNLLPKDMVTSTADQEALKRAKQGFVLVCAACAILVVTGIGRNVYAHVRHNQLEKRIQELSYIQEIFDENERAAKKAQNFENFDASTKTMNEHLNELIEAFEDSIPVKSYVQSVDISNESISVNVISDEKPAAAQLLINFKRIPYITNVDIKNLIESEIVETSDTFWSYTVTADYNANYEAEQEAASQEN